MSAYASFFVLSVIFIKSGHGTHSSSYLRSKIEFIHHHELLDNPADDDDTPNRFN